MIKICYNIYISRTTCRRKYSCRQNSDETQINIVNSRHRSQLCSKSKQSVCSTSQSYGKVSMCHSKFLSLGTMYFLSVPSSDHLKSVNIHIMILAAAFFAKHRNTQNGIGFDDVDCGLFFSKKIQLECRVAPLSEWTIYTHIYIPYTKLISHYWTLNPVPQT